MALRPTDREPLRAAAITSTVAGVVLVESSAVRGPAAVIGASFVCLGVALFDGLGRGRFGRRQAGVFLGTLAVSLGSWSLLVLAFLGLIGEAPGREVYALLGASALAGVGAVRAIRRPQPRRSPRGRRAGIVVGPRGARTRGRPRTR